MAKQKRLNKNKTKEVEELKNQLARALADYDNLRKRSEKEKESFEKILNARFVGKLLPVFDMIENAQNHLNDSGLAIAIDELFSKLKEEGVARIEPKRGDRFDGELHEAVDSLEQDKLSDGQILETVLKGWIMNDFVLRPAKVIVAKRRDKDE